MVDLSTFCSGSNNHRSNAESSKRLTQGTTNETVVRIKSYWPISALDKKYVIKNTRMKESTFELKFPIIYSPVRLAKLFCFLVATSYFYFIDFHNSSMMTNRYCRWLLTHNMFPLSVVISFNEFHVRLYHFLHKGG